MQQTAWLWTAREFKGKPLSARGETYVEKDKPLPAPENPDPEITGMLMRAGPDMGDHPLTAQELAAWATGAGVALGKWEFETLLHLSHAYLVQRQRAKDPDCPPPWQSPTTEAEKPKIAKRIRGLLRS